MEHFKMSIEHVKQAINLLIRPGDVHELRVPKAGKLKTVSGYFDDPEKLAQAIVELSGVAEGVYITLNPVNPTLLARTNNRWKGYSETLTGDGDIVERLWLLVDIDPQRPAGISSTDIEKVAARTKAREVRAYLLERGWPLPIAADSGNGYHLRYRIKLPNNSESTQLVKDCLNALSAKFSDEVVKVDTSVFNASRIVKAYGSLAAKGDSTEERPHRYASLVKSDYSVATEVPVELLQALAAEAPKKEQPKKGISRTGAAITPEKMEQWLDLYGIKHNEAKRISVGWMWILKPCPLDSSHIGTSPAVILRDDGTLCFECKHDSCQIPWKEFRARVEELHPDKPKFHFVEKEDTLGKYTSKWKINKTEEVEEGSTLPSWENLADELDELRVGKEEYVDEDGKSQTKKLPRHIVDENIYQFVLTSFRARANLFFDAYPFVYLPNEEKIIRFHDDREAYTLLGNMRLRVEQHDAKLVKNNLSLHIQSHGEATQIERWGCFRNNTVYVNNGRKGIFKITTDSIDEVPNGTDGVYMLAEEVGSWPELNEENRLRMESISRALGRFGLKTTDSCLCSHLNALFEEDKMTPEQYHQLFLCRYLSLFLSGYSKLRPISLALGEQNSGKSTLFEKIMWLIMGADYESEGLPKDLRGLLAAITNHHLKIFDNIDSADVEELGYADYFCKAATGGTVSIAQLYSTNVDRTYNLRCDLFFTSRYNPWPSHRSDLSRRTLFFPIRKPKLDEYKTVEVMLRDLLVDRDEMLLETLVRLQNVLRGLLSNEEKNYPPQSEMHSFETFTMRAADYEGWAREMTDIWKSYFADYQQKVTEYSPIVDEVRKWLGYPGANNEFPNFNRWVTTGELFKYIKKLGGRDCTWKNESTFGRAMKKHLSALRVIGINEKKKDGYQQVKFDPSPEQLKVCKSAYTSSGLHLFSNEPDCMPYDVL
jgi:hypothetical protein